MADVTAWLLQPLTCLIIFCRLNRSVMVTKTSPCGLPDCMVSLGNDQILVLIRRFFGRFLIKRP